MLMRKNNIPKDSLDNAYRIFFEDKGIKRLYEIFNSTSKPIPPDIANLIEKYKEKK